VIPLLFQDSDVNTPKLEKRSGTVYSSIPMAEDSYLDTGACGWLSGYSGGLEAGNSWVRKLVDLILAFRLLNE